MAEDGLTELALLFKNRDVKAPLSITTGVVISPPPNPQIRLNDVVVLDKNNLIFAAGMLSGYKRNIKFTDTNSGTTSSVNDGGMGASSHSHIVQELNVDTVMEWTDTVVKGDEVILVPVVDGQLYYVLDKGVRF